MTIGFDDNTGGTSTTTGTGPIVLSGAITGKRDIRSVLSNGAQRVFIMTGGSDWMLFVGTYATSGTQITVNSVTKSSAANTAVNWSAGTKYLMITARWTDITNMDYMVEGTTNKILTAEERAILDSLVIEEPDDLGLAAPLQGDESLPGIQGGLAKQFTPDLLLPDATTRKVGFYYNRLHESTKFFRTAGSFSTTSNNVMFGNENVRTYITTGATVSRYENVTPDDGFYMVGGCVLTVPATTTSLAGISFSAYPLLISATQTKFKVRMYGGMYGIPNNSSNQGRFYFGIFNDISASFTEGLFFYLDFNYTNWQCFSRSAGNADIQTDSGIARGNVGAFQANFLSFEIKYDPDVGEVQFFIDGAEVGSHATTTFPDTSTITSSNAMRCGAFVTVGSSSGRDHFMVLDSMHLDFEAPTDSITFGNWSYD